MNIRATSIKYAYPVLFAVVPVVTLAADHIGQFYMSDLLTLVGVSAATALGMWIVLRALPWKGDRSAVAALIAFFGVFLLFYLFPLAEVVGRALPVGRYRWIVLSIAVASTIALWWIARRPTVVAKATVFLSIMGVILVIQASVRLGIGLARGASFIEESELVLDLRQPFPMQESALTASAPQRDVFLILLDMYANEHVLAKVFQYDNRSFLDSLRTFGFTLPEVRSNYTRTILSLTSILNLLTTSTGLRMKPGLDHMTARSAGTSLRTTERSISSRARGIAFHFYPPLWGGLTERNPRADVTFRPRRTLLQSVLAKSSLHRRLWGSTVLGEFVRGSEDRYDVQSILRSFESLRQTPDSDEPLFVFAHFFVPHNPYILDEMCNPAGGRSSNDGTPSDLGSNRGLYIAQAEMCEPSGASPRARAARAVPGADHPPTVRSRHANDPRVRPGRARPCPLRPGRGAARCFRRLLSAGRERRDPPRLAYDGKPPAVRVLSLLRYRPASGFRQPVLFGRGLRVPVPSSRDGSDRTTVTSRIRAFRFAAPLVLFCCFSSPLLAQETRDGEQEAGEKEKERRNSLELFVGFVTETDESATGPGFGIEYKRQISSRWYLGVEAIEISTNDVSRSWLVVVPAYFNPLSGLGLKAGPGLEGSSEEPEDGGESGTTTQFVVRVGAGWEFELGERFTLTPEANLDLVGGSASLVYGASFGLRF